MSLNAISVGYVRYAVNPNEAKAAVNAIAHINEENAADAIQFASLVVLEGEEEEK